MGQINPTIPVTGNLNSVADPEVSNALTAIIQLLNGNLDATNMSAAFLQSIGGNTGGQVSKGVTVNAGPGSRTNTAYGALGDAPDQVAGIVLPTNGLIQVEYQATWQESVAGAARAAIFIGANQQQIAGAEGAAVKVAAATGQATGAASHNTPLTSCPMGLVSAVPGTYSGDVTTGQAAGLASANMGTMTVELGGTVESLSPQSSGSAFFVGGPCTIFNLPAATYTISVQFKSSSGSVTASNRHLLVQALSYS